MTCYKYERSHSLKYTLPILLFQPMRGIEFITGHMVTIKWFNIALPEKKLWCKGKKISFPLSVSFIRKGGDKKKPVNTI